MGTQNILNTNIKGFIWPDLSFFGFMKITLFIKSDFQPFD